MSKGSDPAPDDFELVRSLLIVVPMTLTANGGRSESTLPCFNFSGRNNGVVLAVGWSGQWYTALSQGFDGVKIKVKQEEFKAYLKSGETVRSISMTVAMLSRALTPTVILQLTAFIPRAQSRLRQQVSVLRLLV